MSSPELGCKKTPSILFLLVPPLPRKVYHIVNYIGSFCSFTLLIRRLEVVVFFFLPKKDEKLSLCPSRALNEFFFTLRFIRVPLYLYHITEIKREKKKIVYSPIRKTTTAKSLELIRVYANLKVGGMWFSKRISLFWFFPTFILQNRFSDPRNDTLFWREILSDLTLVWPFVYYHFIFWLLVIEFPPTFFFCPSSISSWPKLVSDCFRSKYLKKTFSLDEVSM